MDQEFKKIVASVLEKEAESLDENSGMDTMAEWDSVAHWEIIDAVESEKGINFSMDEASKLHNLKEIYTAVEEKLKDGEAK